MSSFTGSCGNRRVVWAHSGQRTWTVDVNGCCTLMVLNVYTFICFCAQRRHKGSPITAADDRALINISCFNLSAVLKCHCFIVWAALIEGQTDSCNFILQIGPLIIDCMFLQRPSAGKGTCRKLDKWTVNSFSHYVYWKHQTVTNGEYYLWVYGRDGWFRPGFTEAIKAQVTKKEIKYFFKLSLDPNRRM